MRLFDEIRYFFYLTNDWVSEAEEIVHSANDRGNQENILAQLHGGCHALRSPVNTLVSNWAYMVMTSLAWNLKAWWALMQGPRIKLYQDSRLLPGFLRETTGLRPRSIACPRCFSWTDDA